MLQKIVQLHAIVCEKNIRNSIVKMYILTRLGRCALLTKSGIFALSTLGVKPIPSTMRMLLTAAATPAVVVILIVGVT